MTKQLLSASLYGALTCFAPLTAQGTPTAWQAFDQFNRHMMVSMPTGNLLTIIRLTHHQNSGKGHGLRFGLFHNSTALAGGTVGAGWTHSYNDRIEWPDANSAVLILSDGTRIEFTKIGNQWQAIDPDRPGTLTQDGSGWTFTTAAMFRLEFDAGGRLTREIDANGATVTVTRDAQARVQTVTDAAGRFIQLDYAGDRLATFYDSGWDETAQLHYDSEQRLDHVAFSNASSISVTIDSSELIQTLVTRDGHVWNIDYGSGGAIEQTERSDGVIETYTRTTVGSDLHATLVDRHGSTWTFVHDFAGRMTKRVDPLGGEFSYAYGDDYLADSALDENGQTWLFERNNLGLITRVEDPTGDTAAFEYDSLGSLTRIEDALARTTNLAFEDARFPRSVTSVQLPNSAGGGMGQTAVDIALEYYGDGDEPTGMPANAWSGRIKESKGPDGTEWFAEYDAFGQISLTREGPGDIGYTNVVTENHSFNGPGERGVTTAWPSTPRYPNSWPAIPSMPSEIGTFRDLQGIFATDSVGRLTNVWQTGAVTIDGVFEQTQRSESIVYDQIGRPTSVSVTYDDFGPAITRSYAFAYDDSAHTQTIDLPNGDRVTKQLDAAGRLTTLTLQRTLSSGPPVTLENLVFSFNYGADGARRRISFPDGSQIRYRHYDDGQLKRITYLDAQGTELYKRRLFYDAANQLTSVTELANGVTTATTNYTYDDLGQVLRETRTGSNAFDLRYTYDRVGNRLSKEDLLANRTTTYWYDNYATQLGFAGNAFGSANNRLMGFEVVEAGALKETTWLFYDGHDEGNVSYVASRRHDHAAAGIPEFAGRRLIYSTDRSPWILIDETWELDSSGAISGLTRESVTELRTDHRGPYAIVQRDPVTFARLATETTVIDRDLAGFADGLGTVHKVSGSGAVNEVGVDLAGYYRIRDGNAFSIIADQVGNALRWVGPSGVAGLNRVYTAFGEVVSSMGSTNVDAGFSAGFGGQELDLQHGRLNSIGVRLYDPASGRWLQRDPIGFAGGMNVYGYVFNHPTGLVDPTGLEGITPDEASRLIAIGMLEAPKGHKMQREEPGSLLEGDPANLVPPYELEFPRDLGGTIKDHAFEIVVFIGGWICPPMKPVGTAAKNMKKGYSR